MIAEMIESMRAWATGRWWQWRLPLFLFFAVQASEPLRAFGEANLFTGIIFGAHEFGHLLFSFGGEWLTIAGGSLTQLLVPIGAAFAVGRSKDWFGVAICGLFLASSLGDLSWYIADARAQDLDLVSFSPDGGGHDWHYLLGHAGLLKRDLAIASFTRLVGWCTILASAVLSARLFWWMQTRKPVSDADSADVPGPGSRSGSSRPSRR